MIITKHSKYIYYILSCILILSTDTFIVATNQNRNIFYCSILLLVISLIYMLIGNVKISKRNIIIFLILLIFISMNMLYHQDISNGNVYKILLLLYGIVLCSFMDFSIFRTAYVEIMTVVCSFSLLLYILSFFISFSDYFPVITNIVGIKVAFVWLSNVHINITDSIIRNYGPFWEPGVFAIYLCIAIIFALKDEQTRIPVYVYIFVCGIITTLSTTGIILLALILSTNLLASRGNQRKHCCVGKIGILFIFICCGMLFLFNSNIYEMIFAKLSPESWKFSSTLTRLYSAYANIIIFLDNLVLGCGINNYTAALSHYYESQGMLSFIGKEIGTNGLLIQFAMYGGIIGAVYLWGLFSFCAVLTRTTRLQYILFFLFILMLCAEPLQMSLLFNVFIFWMPEKKKTSVTSYALRNSQ